MFFSMKAEYYKQEGLFIPLHKQPLFQPLFHHPSEIFKLSLAFFERVETVGHCLPRFVGKAAWGNHFGKVDIVNND